MNNQTLLSFIFIKIFLLICIFCPVLEAVEIPIALSSQRGKSLLINSRYRSDFQTLMQYYESQTTNTYCGVASGVMVLNALKIPKSKTPHIESQKMSIQQAYFFNDNVSRLVPEYIVKQRGMKISELKGALQSYGVNVNVHYQNFTDIYSVRHLLKSTLNDPNSFIITCYLREGVGQSGGGHYSPIAAYNEQEDKVLILDVSHNHYPPVWINLNTLLKSMQPDHINRIGPRAFIHVSKSTNNHTFI